jgi:hypothetical protein
MISSQPVASSIFTSYCKKRDVSLLRDYLYQDDQQYETALLEIEEAIKTTVGIFWSLHDLAQFTLVKNVEQKTENLKKSLELTKNKKEFAAEHKVSVFSIHR